MTKVITYYLPQFHSIPENDEVWGEGFTEWDNVRSATPYSAEHNQPRVPLNDNYYNLLDEQTIKWQTDLARDNGIYGFCIYHYWFSGKKLLNKPVELMRDSESINFPYTICWANENWTDAWVSTGKPKTFLEQKYGDEAEWIEHFNYLATFFKDPNYIKNNNKPLLVIYRPETITDLNGMLELWNKMAIEMGFDGISYAYQQLDFEKSGSDDSLFDYSIEYQPKYALEDYNDRQPKVNSLKISKALTPIRKLKNMIIKKKPRVVSYSELAKLIVKRRPKNDKSVAGMFVGYDDTPRKQERGMIIESTPDEFKKYFELQVENINENYKSDYLFLFAWNEWAESGYLEPDTKYGTKYLEIIKDVLETENKKGM